MTRITDPNTVNRKELPCDLCGLRVKHDSLHYWCTTNMTRIHVECDTRAGRSLHWKNAKKHRHCRDRHLVRDIKPLFPDKKKRRKKSAVKHPIEYSDRFKAYYKLIGDDTNDT